MTRSQRKKKAARKKKQAVGEDFRSRKKKQVRSFVESLFGASTRDCIEVDIESLKKFLESGQWASNALLQTLEFKEISSLIVPLLVESTWKGWACCYCARYFADSALNLQHIFNDHLKHHHLKDLVDFTRDFAPSFPPQWTKKILDGCWKPIDVGGSILFTGGTHDWDVSLAMLFRTLLQRGILHTSHLDSMLDYAMTNLPSAEVLEANGVDRNSILCFRCLEAPQLEHVQDFLKDLLRTCKEQNPTCYDDDDDKFHDPPDNNIRVVVDDSRSSILIYADKWFIPSDDSNDNVSYNLDSVAVISWLYDEPPLTVEDTAKSWFLSRYTRNALCDQLLKEFEAKYKELSVLHRLADHWMSYKETLQNLVVIQSFEEERETRTHNTTIQSSMDFLEGWQEHLPEDESKVFSKAFTKILKDAEDMKASENGENGDDNYITKALSKALSKEKQELSMKFHVNAAKVKKNIYDGQQLMSRIRTVSSFDYHTVVISVVKHFLRAKWEHESEHA